MFQKEYSVVTRDRGDIKRYQLWDGDEGKPVGFR